MVGWPACRRAELSSATIPLKVGAAAEVPCTALSIPLSMTRYLTDCAATSGKPRPVALNSPVKLLPIVVCRYVDTACSW